VTGCVSGSAETKAKGGSIARQAALVDVSLKKVVVPILPVGQRWHSAKVLKVRRQPVKRLLQKELVGKRNKGLGMEDRLDRIETKVDKLSEAMVEMVRMEERMVTAFKRMDNIVEYQKKSDDRLDEMEKQALVRGQKIAFAERIFWMIATGIVGLCFVFLR
jgi:hypothetical protein